MDRLACGYTGHGRIGAGLTLTLDMAVSRVRGLAGGGKEVKKKRAKAEENAVFHYYFYKYHN